MDIQAVSKALIGKAESLRQPHPIQWRYPARPLAKPLEGRIKANWGTWSYEKFAILKKNEKNWFYADVTIPAMHGGMTLKDVQAHFYIIGHAPFTMWIDGEELFRENHAWNATGPIFEPVALDVKPGQTVRLVLCVEPTEIPTGFDPLQVWLLFKPCLDESIELAAACSQLRFAQALAVTKAEKNQLAKATAAVDIKALGAHRWARVNASLAAMEEALEPFRKKAHAHTIRLLGHSHIDMDWRWAWEDTVHCIRRDFKAVTDMMDDYKDLTFIHSQAPTYQVVEKTDPDVFEKVVRLNREGRWENAAGTWVEGDLNMADGEAVARQMLYAAGYTDEKLGSKARILWEPDTFGHPGNMPQLARLGEFDAYYHFRCNPGGYDNWPVRQWEGIDGTRILAFSSTYTNLLLPNSIIHNVLGHLKYGFKDSHLIWGMGDHGGGMAREQLRILSLYRDKPVMPAIRFGTMAEMVKAIGESGVTPPVNRGESFSLFEGCFTTHAKIKAYNRRCECGLLDAEVLTALAGLDRRKALAGAWTDALFNQFHDIFDGAAVPDAYRDAYVRAEKSLKTAAKTQNEALKAVTSTRGKAGKTLTLVNTLGFARTEPVRIHLPKSTRCLRDETGRILPVQRIDGDSIFVARGVPAFSKMSYSLLDSFPRGSEPQAIRVNVKDPYAGVDLANPAGEGNEPFYEIETAYALSRLNRRNGVIASHIDKALARELIAYGYPRYLTHTPTTRGDLAMNVFQIIDESPNVMPAWLIHDVRREENLLGEAKVELIDQGPVFARFRLTRPVRSSQIVEDIIYYNEDPRIDLNVKIDWREQGGPEAGIPQLKLAFTGALTAARARAEGPYCVTERPADGQEQPTQKWVDLTGEEFGFTLLNDCRHGYDALGGRLRMTLLRNSYGPDPESDNGEHTINLSLIPHGPAADNARSTRQGMAFNRPLIATQGPLKPLAPPFRIECGENVLCTALRDAEHSGGTILRFFETEGREGRIRIETDTAIVRAEAVNFIENAVPDQPAVKDRLIEAVMRGHEVKTILIEFA